MTNLRINQYTDLSPGDAPVEMVERKGIGHPDTICDALAEALSLALSRYYRDHFELILHHNVDKALLWGGVSQPQFGGGRVVEPMEIFLAGRATGEFKGRSVPVEELVVETARQWFAGHFHALDAQRHVQLHPLIRPGSADLVDLYLRQQQTGIALANDTSCGVGYAPLDELERLVQGVEAYLNSDRVKREYPFVGEDVKVMGVREGDDIDLTVGCAFVDRHLQSLEGYFEAKARLADLIEEHAGAFTGRQVSVTLNAADGEDRDSVYLTVSGTSAEGGDDGQVGRGNRVNGLITPYRPMNMEAAAGKNPVTHVGKCYNIAAGEICTAIVEELPAVRAAQCFLVSRIGHPITEPQVTELRLQLHEQGDFQALRARAEAIAREHLDKMPALQDRILDGAIKVY